MATSSAKSGSKASSSKSTKKKTTSASSSKKAEAQSSDGLGLGTILDVVGQLAGGGSSSHKKPAAESNLLTSLLSSLTGGGNSGSSTSSSINYTQIIEMLLPILLSNTKHSDSFKKDPGNTIHQLTGVKIDKEHLGPIVEQILGKL